MKKKNSNIEFFLEYTGYGVLVCITIFWNYFSKIWPLKLEHLIIILVTLVATSNIAWSKKLNAIESKIAPLRTYDSLSCKSLQNAFNEIISHKKTIKCLRIYAISTGIIQPIIRTLPENTVENCRVMIRDFYEGDPQKNETFCAELNQIIQRWYNLETDGFIKNLELTRYKHYPTEYQCIFDDDAMILGIYHPEAMDSSNVKVKANPIVITKEIPEGKEIINEYIDRFDIMVKEFKNE